MVNMKDLEKLINEVMNELSSLKIKYRKVRNWKTFSNKKSQLGFCETVSSGVFDISISEILLDDNIDDQLCKNTIAHELLHTVEGCMNHKQHWKKLANLINEQIPVYNIKRTFKPEEIGIEVSKRKPIYHYFFKCKGCGVELKYQRKGKFVEHPERYYCRHCGNKFERIK